MHNITRGGGHLESLIYTGFLFGDPSADRWRCQQVFPAVHQNRLIGLIRRDCLDDYGRRRDPGRDVAGATHSPVPVPPDRLEEAPLWPSGPNHIRLANANLILRTNP